MELTAVVRAAWFPGLAIAPRVSVGGVRDWLIAGAVPTNSAGMRFDFRYADEMGLAKHFAIDANRFACRAVETVDAIEPNTIFPKASAWSAIELYYAAYFSAIFLLRSCGRGPLYLETEAARKLRDVANTYGLNFGSLTAGAYAVTTDQPSKTVSLRRFPPALGVHETLWKEFSDFLAVLERTTPSLLASDEEKHETATALSDLRTALQRKNSHSGNWLSNVRNEINYRTQDRFWFPYNKTLPTAQFLRKLQRCDELFDASRLTIKSDDEMFFSLGSYLFGWALTVMRDLSARSQGAKTVFRMGVHNYLERTALRHLVPTA